MDEMHDLNDMYMFAKVIEHGGYSDRKSTRLNSSHI